MQTRLRLDFNESTLIGNALHHTLYGRNDILTLVNYWSGCPNNGGQHTLLLKDTRENLIIWCELWMEQFPYIKHYIVQVIEELKKKSSVNQISLRKMFDPDYDEYHNWIISRRPNSTAYVYKRK